MKIINFNGFSEVFPFLEVAKVNYIFMHHLNNLFPSNILMIFFLIIDIIKIFRNCFSLFCFRTDVPVEAGQIIENHCRNFPLENGDV